MDALARLGYNVENMASPLPTMTKIASGLTSLVDTQYDNAMKWQKSQADAQEAVARAGNIDSQTDFNNQATDLRIKELDLQNQQRQQTLDFADSAQPVRQRMLENQGKASDIDIQNAQRATDDQRDAQDKLAVALKSLPNPSDPNFDNAIDQWQTDNAALIARTDTPGKQAQTALGMVQGRYKATSQFNQRLGDIKEFEQLQGAGYIPTPLDADHTVFSGNAQPQLIKGRMLQAQDQIQQILSDPSVPQNYRDSLRPAYNYVHSFVGSDTGVQDVTDGKASPHFS
jgi:hypothetical protein